MEKDTILYSIKKNKRLIESLGATKIGLFGSYSLNNQVSSSDVDLIVHIDEKAKTYDNYISLAMFLEDLLGKPIDLITPESISEDFYNCIKNDIIYAY